MKKIVFLSLFLFLLLACQSPSKKQPETAPLMSPAATAPACDTEVLCDCPAPGQTLRWELNYCQAKLKSDSCGPAYKCADEMKKKFKKQLKKRSNCAKNQFWRTKYCTDFHKDTRQDCLKEIPDVIKKGC